MSPLWLILACTLGDAPAKPVPIRTDFAMDSDPVLPEHQVVKVYSPKYLPLWLQALDRPEADLQRLAAETVAQAHIEGVPKMIEAKPALVRIVSAKQTHPAARFTAARALIVLESKDAAPQLLQAAQDHEANLRQLVEPALARWKHAPAFEVWRKRLANEQVKHRDLMLALRCLGNAGDQSALPQLLAIMHAPQRLDAERLAAAHAAGQLQEAGLETDAQKLTRPGAKLIDRLCGVALLERHSSEPAKSVLFALAEDPEPTIASRALRRLNALDFSLVLPLAEKAIKNPDSGVRREGARAYAARPSLERINSLGQLLDDPHSDLRSLVREDLRRLADDPQWNDAIRQRVMEAAAGEGWRGQEQAALLLGDLDHEPGAPRLIQLLESPRSEVMIASAWALRKLSMPETLPTLLKRAEHLTEVRLRLASFEPLDIQAAHLLEALGQMNYEPAEPLMRRYVPKDYTMGQYSRGAAIWSLGLLHVGKPDEALAAAIAGRVTEPSVTIPPEMERVRLAGAIALGKMKAKSQSKLIQGFLVEASGGSLYMAIRWALKEMGEEIPLPAPLRISKGGWFLEPINATEDVVP